MKIPRRQALLAVTLLGTLTLSACVTPASQTGSAAANGSANCSATGAIAQIPGLSAAQQAEIVPNALAIAAAAAELNLPAKAVQVADVAAFTESGMRNLNVGDFNANGIMTTSRGMFQMKDAWGPLADRLDPKKAATIFFTIDKGPGVRGLIHIPGWEQMTIPQAAQAVEGSQFTSGSNYEQNLPIGLAIASATSTASMKCTPGAGAGGMQQNPSQDPSSFGWVRAANQVPFSWQGHQFGQVAAGTEALWTGLLNELVPQIPGGLNNNLGCFENRNNVNNPGIPSFHAYGLACDINSDANPNGVAPGRTGNYVIPPAAARAAAAHWGMEWGGDFSGSPDGMHFEIHLSPQQAAQASQANIAP